MDLGRIFKTIFLVEFISGLFLAVKELFKKSKTINFTKVPKKSGKYRGPRVEVLEVRSTKKKLEQEELDTDKSTTDGAEFSKDNK